VRVDASVTTRDDSSTEIGRTTMADDDQKCGDCELRNGNHTQSCSENPNRNPKDESSGVESH
jgi:hypothetical protein